ncbi:helix-turn-helix domain-containing protein [Vibrio methylphosphonaticus]|uniref:helix-turn-helix domain-containing protein n=1 Tax=Vibrio methylphosphonaticus TaxID=2946866 RepID=UPI002029CD73|nr:helix-turn-helix domain-containing protein [Vibrio methylphosphonaticus]MCL9775170.1 AraC family transcriptional regulator [Vibrio methylphosphonaticus]
MVSKRKPIHLNRVEKVVEYINNNLDKPLTVAELASISCWSRWQLQRVFQEQTKQNIAQYVRQQKLSRAAEHLLSNESKITDIALEFGFNSEVSFSRAFKQLFSVSPRQYKQQGMLKGIRLPLVMSPELPLEQSASQVVRIETRTASTFFGVHAPIDTLYTINPQYSTQAARIWRQFTQATHGQRQDSEPVFGVIDTIHPLPDTQLIYWASCEHTNLDSQQVEYAKSHLDCLTVPEQTYAVITHVGPIANFPKTLEWVLNHWLPLSGFYGEEGYELERYPSHYNPLSSDACMEFWLPIRSADTK